MIKIYDCAQVGEEEIFARENPTANVAEAVADIIATVRQKGDAALYEYARRFDKVELTALAVTEAELDQAFAAVDEDFIAVLRQAAANIRAFHEKQVRNGFFLERQGGAIIGQKITPIEKVGLYVPGGTAAYPSTVLMDAIPAKIAGCEEIVVVTPPGKDGKVNPAILVAAKIAGVDRIFKVGGAQAVAALAYGTESVPKVDKIVGPGNAWESKSAAT